MLLTITTNLSAQWRGAACYRLKSFLATVCGHFAAKNLRRNVSEILDILILPNIPDGRLAEAKEVAALVIYLCSKEAAFLTGGNIAINGGQHLQ